MNTFKDLHIDSQILKSIEKLGYQEPTEVQREVIPMILGDKENNMIVKSHTGSGKTAAFAIPLSEKMEWDNNHPTVLILAPTRELAFQIREDMQSFGVYKRLKTIALVGRQPYKQQLRELSQKVHAVVGTPGRVLDHIERGSLHVEDIHYLVLDEADEMLNMGFIDQVEDIINTLTNRKVSLLFSATMPDEIRELTNRYMEDATFIEIDSHDALKSSLKQRMIGASYNEKSKLLEKVLGFEHPDSCIIFANTREMVENIRDDLHRWKIKCAMIHGGMFQEERLKEMERFSKGSVRFLVATDVAARGIDIDKVSHVINYEIPNSCEKYMHRIGRTARKNDTGIAFSFADQRERELLNQVMKEFQQDIIEIPIRDYLIYELREEDYAYFKSKPQAKDAKNKHIKDDITTLYISAGKKKKIHAKDIVGSLMEIDGVEFKDIGIIDVRENITYVDILNEKGQIILDGFKDKKIKGKEVRVEIQQNHKGL